MTPHLEKRFTNEVFFISSHEVDLSLCGAVTKMLDYDKTPIKILCSLSLLE